MRRVRVKNTNREGVIIEASDEIQVALVRHLDDGTTEVYQYSQLNNQDEQTKETRTDQRH